MIVALCDMRAGQRGIVADICGGRGMVSRLHAMGLRPGMPIIKKSAQPMRGPVVVQVGQTELAIGFGMARRIGVEVQE